LSKYTPVQRESKGVKVVTQYDMYSLDLNVAGEGRAVGLLKIDFLGLRNLTILEKTLEYVQVIRGKKIDISSISLDNKEVYEMISEGETTGVFQLESAGMRRLARKLKPSKFSDLAAMVALFRPGPMDWIDDFIKGKNNPKSVHYPHKDLKKVLSETYGIAVYQEQCMQIASIMAGYTLAEGDILRRAIGKKKKSIMEKEKKKFVAKAIKKGYAEKVARTVFALIERFSGYGFNKAHAAGYAMIAYQTAYMKAKFPVEFMAAVLTAESGAASGPARDEKLSRAVSECKRVKIPVLPPDIDLSKTGFAVEKINKKCGIRFGLSAIKNVGTAAISSILGARREGKFKDLTDFAFRVDLSKVNKKTFESLIKAGAMDKFGRRSSMLAGLEKILTEIHKEKKRQASGQTSLFEGLTDKNKAGNFTSALPEIDEIPKKQLLAYEKDFLGLYLTEHPLADILSYLEKEVDESIANLSRDFHLGKMMKLGGIISNVRIIRTRKNNAEMAFVRIEDRLGSGEVVVFPSIFEKTRSVWLKDQAVLFRGKVNEKEEKISVIVESAEHITEDTEKGKVKKDLAGGEDQFNDSKTDLSTGSSGATVIVLKSKKSVKIFIPSTTRKERLGELKEFLKARSGEFRVFVYILNGEVTKKITTNYKIDPTKETINKIESLLST